MRVETSAQVVLFPGVDREVPDQQRRQQLDRDRHETVERGERRERRSGVRRRPR